MELDANLTWNDHVNRIISSLNRSIFVLRHFAKTYHDELAITTYHALFASKLAYGIEIWGTCASGLMEKVFLVQKRAVRTMQRLPFLHPCKEIFKKLKIMTVPSMFVYKLILYADNQKNILGLNCDIHNHETRNRSNFYTVQNRTSKAHNGTKERAKRAYNKLSITAKQLPSHILKEKLKQHLLQTACYTVEEALTSLV